MRMVRSSHTEGFSGQYQWLIKGSPIQDIFGRWFRLETCPKYTAELRAAFYSTDYTSFNKDPVHGKANT